jgi:hypothetical protein
MDGHLFKVFGTLIAVAKGSSGWQAFCPGSDGKRRAADFIVPPELAEHELAGYLADLFHENATPRHNSVERIA